MQILRNRQMHSLSERQSGLSPIAVRQFGTKDHVLCSSCNNLLVWSIFSVIQSPYTERLSLPHIKDNLSLRSSGESHRNTDRKERA
jgi:hypothetical protein